MRLVRLLAALMVAGSGVAAHAARDDALLAAATAERDATLATLNALVSFDSGTGNGDGVRRVADVAEPALKAMGFVTERLDAKPSPGVNLVGRLDGTGKRRLLLLAHMDTVYLDGTAAKQPFRVDGDRAYGAGIADDKGGMVVALHATRLLLASGFRDFARLTVAFTADEEKGSPGSRDLIRRLASEHDAVFSFEGTGVARETIRTATSGVSRFHVTIAGKASHAGVAPEAGVNALVEAADLVLRTQDIDDRARGLRFTWTVERAGDVDNVVPDRATLTADVRYRREADFAEAEAKLRERAARQRLPGARIDIVAARGRPPLAPTDVSRRIAAQAVAIYAEIGATLVESGPTGGGTDAAYAAQANGAVVESMGLPGAGAHSNDDEYVRIDRIPARLYLAARLMQDVLKGP